MIKQIAALQKAADQLGIPYTCPDPDQNIVVIDSHEGKLLFQQNRTPFNDESMASICRDKGHTYHLLKNAVQMPVTLEFLDPEVDSRYSRYLKFHDYDAVFAEIEAHLNYPVVVKPNRGALGRHVALCRSREEVQAAMRKVFNKEQRSYDYVALVQQFVPTEREYRLVAFRGQPLLSYERFLGVSETKLRYWENPEGKALHITDEAIIAPLWDSVKATFDTVPLGWVGFDIAVTKDGDHYLFELNSGPRFDHFIDDNGDTAVITMYQTVLTSLASN